MPIRVRVGDQAGENATQRRADREREQVDADPQPTFVQEIHVRDNHGPQAFRHASREALHDPGAQERAVALGQRGPDGRDEEEA